MSSFGTGGVVTYDLQQQEAIGTWGGIEVDSVSVREDGAVVVGGSARDYSGANDDRPIVVLVGPGAELTGTGVPGERYGHEMAVHVPAIDNTFERVAFDHLGRVVAVVHTVTPDYSPGPGRVVFFDELLVSRAEVGVVPVRSSDVSGVVTGFLGLAGQGDRMVVLSSYYDEFGRKRASVSALETP